METIERIVEKCNSIYRRAESVKVYKTNCDTIAERVHILERLVKGIEKKGPDHITPTVSQSLIEVLMTLTTAEEHITKFTRSSTIKGSSAKTKDNEAMFGRISKKIDDGLQVLNAAQAIDSPIAPKQTTYPAGPTFSPFPQPSQTLQVQQFSLAASMPPPPQPLYPATSLPSPTASLYSQPSLPPPTAPLYPTASLTSQTQQYNQSFSKPMVPTFQMSNHMTTVPLHSNNPPASFSTACYGFSVPQPGNGYYANGSGTMTSMSYPTPMNISHQSTSIATNYVVNNPTFQ
ncbi:PREDICTED: formin-like protein 2 [Cyprinodon variegatus]|uniref:formin-like protein 2 n=1 Tax=Cyprinodon variegatus TaxID=28743 RepID=UPI000742C670|nr:PREDICTED: formin-like protein 2 [Cyprinodon variegatus]XP_015253433.1 PREDICTED: formin-like protein 2 [Cyprinodon variegatus]XP_015253434.1 PREDICTED: formin-like protein 2 [Cyprinodon variegatus]